MATYLITGASRGIGLELTKQLLDLPTSQVSKVFALSRTDSPGPLRDLITTTHPPDRAFQIFASVDDTLGVQKAAEEVKAKLGAAQGLDVLINNAAETAACPGGTRTVPPEQMARIFDVNVVGVHRVTAAFLPLLEKGGEKKVVNVYAPPLPFPSSFSEN